MKKSLLPSLLIVGVAIQIVGAVFGREGSGTQLKTKFGDVAIFPADNAWNRDISQAPVHPKSKAFIDSIGAKDDLHPDFGTQWKGVPNGIPFLVVPADQPKTAVKFRWDDESDPGPYPIPLNAPIEGGPKSKDDRHVIVVDPVNRRLYELYNAFPKGNRWNADSGAMFKLDTNELRPAGWTSADAAGLPIFPGLVRYEEVVEQKEVTHAIRFTVRKTQRAYISPARHWASSDRNANLPPMGLRMRLKADFDIEPFPANVQVILRGLKKYGMILADNGGDWFISGAPNPKWHDDELGALKKIRGENFEAVLTGETVTD